MKQRRSDRQAFIQQWMLKNLPRKYSRAQLKAYARQAWDRQESTYRANVKNTLAVIKGA